MRNKYISFKDKSLVILLIILVCSLIIRLVGLSYGLPNLYVVDEAQVVLDGARFHPSLFFKPLTYSVYGPLMSYLINFFLLVYGLILLIVGKISNGTDLYLLFETNKTPFFLIARSISLILQLITIYLIYRLVVKFYKSKVVGLFASLFLTFLPSYLSFGRIAEPESLMALLCTLAIWFSYKVINRGKTIDYISLGFLVGLAISTKYNAYLFVFLIMLSHFLFSLKQNKWIKVLFFSKNFYLSLCLVGVGIFIGHPHLWFKTGEIGKALIENPDKIITIIYPSYSYATSALRTGWMGKETQESFFWLFKAIVINEGSFGLLVYAGVVYALLKHKAIDIILVTLFLLYFFVLSTYTKIGNDIHYLFPIFPVFAVLVGRFLGEVFSVIKLKYRWVYLLLLFIFFFLPTIKNDLLKACELTELDTRSVARDWVESNIEQGAKLAVVPYSPELFDPEMVPSCLNFCNLNKIKPKLGEFSENNPWYKVVDYWYKEERPIWPEGWSDEKIRKYENDVYVSGQYRTTFRNCDFLLEEDVDYVVLSSGFYGRYLDENTFDKSNPLYELFERNKKELRGILGGVSLCLDKTKIIKGEVEYVGPDIYIFKVIHPSQEQNQKQ